MTLNCPICKKWVECGLRRTRVALDKHIKAEHPAEAKQQADFKAELIAGDDIWGLEPAKPLFTQADCTKLAALTQELVGATGVRKAQLVSQIKRLEARR